MSEGWIPVESSIWDQFLVDKPRRKPNVEVGSHLNKQRMKAAKEILQTALLHPGGLDARSAAFYIKKALQELPD